MAPSFIYQRKTQKTIDGKLCSDGPKDHLAVAPSREGRKGPGGPKVIETAPHSLPLLRSPSFPFFFFSPLSSLLCLCPICPACLLASFFRERDGRTTNSPDSCKKTIRRQGPMGRLSFPLFVFFFSLSLCPLCCSLSGDGRDR